MANWHILRYIRLNNTVITCKIIINRWDDAFFTTNYANLVSTYNDKRGFECLLSSERFSYGDST